MAIIPTGPLSVPLQLLRELVAASPSWRVWVGAADAASALERVHLVGPPPPELGGEYDVEELRDLRPMAVVDLWTPPDQFGGEPWLAERNATFAYLHGGKLTLDFVADVPAELAADFAQAKLWYLNKIGAVLAEMRDLAGTGDYLSLRRLSLYAGPVRTDTEKVATQGDFWRSQFLWEWGI